MKRTALVLAAACLALAGCGGGESADASSASLSSAAAASSSAAEASEDAILATRRAHASTEAAKRSADAAAAAASSSAAYAVTHPSFSIEQMRTLAGTACAPEGAVSTALGTSTYTKTPFDNGMSCIGGTWLIVTEANRGCSGAAATVPFATSDGQRLACVNGTLYVEGQPLTGPLYVGDYRVGTDTGQVAPGTYVATDVDGCYWERLDSSGEIIDNNFISAAPRAEFTVRASDYAINIEGCGGWTKQ
jgi:hypothetical protein